MSDLNQQSNINDDEILVLDESGEFKILADGELRDYKELRGKGQGAKDESRRDVKPVKSNLPIDTGMEEKMLQPPPPVLIKKTSSFYFHPEDEEEVAKHKVDTATLAGQKKYSLDKILIKVVENYNLQLNGQLKSRLRQIIYNYLRDRRSLIDLENVFKKPEQSGGLALKEPIVGGLIIFLKEIKGKVSRQHGIVIDEKEEAGKEKIKFVQPPEPAKASVASKPLKPIPLKPKATELKEKLEKQTEETKKQIKGRRVTGMPRIHRPLKAGARRVADVRKDYKLVGPVDELASLTLETFRRLEEGTKGRIAKIISKINLLAEDSLAKKTAGIKAWQKSPLYKMYVAVGQSSMEHGLDVEQIIGQYSKQGRQIISIEEFEAISDLNRKLRF